MSIRSSLTEIGVVGPLAAEFQTQITAKAGSVRRLTELGFVAAPQFVAGLAAGSLRAGRLAEVGVAVEVAKYLAKQINYAPINTTLPAVSGTVAVGQVVTASTGAWNSMAPPAYTRQWQRYSNQQAPFAWADIAGATAATYTIVSGDIGYQIRCIVTATNLNGATPATSAATIVVP